MPAAGNRAAQDPRNAGDRDRDAEGQRVEEATSAVLARAEERELVRQALDDSTIEVGNAGAGLSRATSGPSERLGCRRSNRLRFAGSRRLSGGKWIGSNPRADREPVAHSTDKSADYMARRLSVPTGIVRRENGGTDATTT
jgi:hypothetical protein